MTLLTERAVDLSSSSDEFTILSTSYADGYSPTSTAARLFPYVTSFHQQYDDDGQEVQDDALLRNGRPERGSRPSTVLCGSDSTMYGSNDAADFLGAPEATMFGDHNSPPLASFITRESGLTRSSSAAISVQCTSTIFVSPKLQQQGWMMA